MDANSPLDALDNPGLLRTQALINGDWMGGATTFAVTDPATGRELAQVPNLGRAEAQELVDSMCLILLDSAKEFSRVCS